MKKILIINRGLPGSGKSYWVNHVEPHPEVASLDDFRYIDGKYVFDSKREDAVKNKFKEKVLSLLNTASFIVIDNMNLVPKNYKWIIDKAESEGFECFLFSFKPKALRVHAKYNKHNVSYQRILVMNKSYQADDGQANNFVIENNKDIENALSFIDNKFSYSGSDMVAKVSYKRCSKHELDMRVREVAKLLIGGASTFYVHEFIRDKKDWNITSRQVENYLRKARELISDINNRDIEMAISEQCERLDDLYRRSMGLQDFRTCLSITAEKNKLLGLHRPVKHDLTSGGDKITGFVVSVEGEDDNDE